MAQFKFKIREHERDLILLRHLITEGEITEAELPLFRSVEKHGRSYFVQFDTEHGQCPLSDSDMREVGAFGYGRDMPLIPSNLARRDAKAPEVESDTKVETLTP